MEHPGIKYPYNYTALFFLGGVILLISYGFLSLNREKIETRSVEKIKSYFFKDLTSIIKSDSQLKLFILIKGLSYSRWIGESLLIIYAMKKFSLMENQMGGLLILLTFSIMLTSLLLGKRTDTLGHKPNFIISNLFYIFSLGVVMLSGSIYSNNNKIK